MAGEVERLQEFVDKYDNIVFFGGAGVSTESGIPDFRSQDGLYHQKYDYPPETILSHTFFMRKPEEFFKFYRDKMLCDTAKPNAAHLKLAELEQASASGNQEILDSYGRVTQRYEFLDGYHYEAKLKMHKVSSDQGVPIYQINPTCYFTGGAISLATGGRSGGRG